MEFFHNPNIDFLSKKWIFLALSLVFSVSGILSMAFWHGIPWGLEFRGGTQVEVKFNGSTSANEVRSKLDKAGLHNARIQPFGPTANNEFLIALDIQETSEQALDRGKNTIIAALEGQQEQGKQDPTHDPDIGRTPPRRHQWLRSNKHRLNGRKCNTEPWRLP